MIMIRRNFLLPLVCCFLSWVIAAQSSGFRLGELGIHYGGLEHFTINTGKRPPVLDILRIIDANQLPRGAYPENNQDPFASSYVHTYNSEMLGVSTLWYFGMSKRLSLGFDLTYSFKDVNTYGGMAASSRRYEVRSENDLLLIQPTLNFAVKRRKNWLNLKLGAWYGRSLRSSTGSIEYQIPNCIGSFCPSWTFPNYELLPAAAFQQYGVLLGTGFPIRMANRFVLEPSLYALRQRMFFTGTRGHWQNGLYGNLGFRVAM